MGYGTLIQFSQIEGKSTRQSSPNRVRIPLIREITAASFTSGLRLQSSSSPSFVPSPSPTSLVLMAKIRRSRYQTDDEAYTR